MGTARSCGLVTMLLASAFCADWSSAQGYPNRPVHIRTAGAGSGSDIVLRLIAPELSTAIGQPVVIENPPPIALPPGVAKATPDGYILMATGANLWVGPLVEAASYSIEEFAAITTLTRSPYTLVVHASLPIKSVQELIAYTKARPGALNYSSSTSAGSGSYLAAEQFKSLAGLDVVRIAYKNQADENTDVLSGRVHMTFGSGAGWDPYIKAGKLRALATGSSRPSPMYPDLPTVSETLPGFLAEQLLGLWAPAKTPDAIIRRMSQETIRVIEKPEMRERAQKIGQEMFGTTPEQFAAYVKGEIARVSKVVSAGKKPGA